MQKLIKTKKFFHESFLKYLIQCSYILALNDMVKSYLEYSKATRIKKDLHVFSFHTNSNKTKFYKAK